MTETLLLYLVTVESEAETIARYLRVLPVMNVTTNGTNATDPEGRNFQIGKYIIKTYG